MNISNKKLGKIIPIDNFISKAFGRNKTKQKPRAYKI
jgi:hypothetical protein